MSNNLVNKIVKFNIIRISQTSKLELGGWKNFDMEKVDQVDRFTTFVPIN